MALVIDCRHPVEVRVAALNGRVVVIGGRDRRRSQLYIGPFSFV